jgi:hypothetical protein
MKRKLWRTLASAVALTVVASALLTGTAHAVGVVGKLKNLNGLCVNVTDANYGAIPLQTTDCTHAHNVVFDFDSLGRKIIWVDGHPDHCLAAGDNPAVMFIAPCSNGRSIIVIDANRTGNDGAVYQRYNFTIGGNTYLAHGSINGQPVGILRAPSTSGSVYWGAFV